MWTWFFLACAQPDEDGDGATADVDCADDDPFVYPGAYDAPADGVDADCADGDPPLPYLGDWAVDTMTATYSGIELFVAGTESGTMSVDEDGTVALELVATLNPAVFDTEIEISVVMAGEFSPAPGPDSFVVYAEGLNYDEQMHVNWRCALEDGVLGCGGELKALDGSFDAEVTLLPG